MRRGASIYAVAWCALMAIYAAALFTSGAPAGLALRNAIANLLPDALAGIVVLRLRATQEKNFIATHLARMVAFILAVAVGWVALIALDSLIFTGKIAVQVNYRIIPFKTIYDMLIYCTLAGIAGVREQADRASKAEALRVQASLEALRSQLNPHFMMNTFHALLGLVRRDPAVAEAGLERLGDLLRYSQRVHRNGVDEVPLRDEVAFVHTYIDLERMRLGDRLRIRVETPAPTLDVLVPTFAIQILAENAIRHAISKRASGGLLTIGAQQSNGHIRIAVRDESDGEMEKRDYTSSGTGLRLLQERMHALYGHDATLTMYAVEGGTSVDLDLPARVSREGSA
jgi:LytS/YehU family sensor histidine kinase